MKKYTTKALAKKQETRKHVKHNNKQNSNNDDRGLYTTKNAKKTKLEQRRN